MAQVNVTADHAQPIDLAQALLASIRREQKHSRLDQRYVYTLVLAHQSRSSSRILTALR